MDIYMKRIISIIALLAVLCTVLVSCKKEGDTPDGMILASGEGAKYYLYIPEDWTVDLQTAVTTAHVSDLSSVSASTWTLQNPADTVDTWHESQLESLNAGFTDYAEVSVSDSILDGVYAKEYVFTAKHGGEDRKYRQVAAVKSGCVYVITYSTTPELFDEHNGDVDDILAEFRFK